MKHYVIYARSASKEQSGKFGLEYQERVIRNFAKLNNLKISDVIQESGTTKISYKTIENVIAKNANGIICLSLDRLTRDFTEMLRIRRVLAKAHISVLTPKAFFPEVAEKHLIDAVLYGLSAYMSMENDKGLRIKRGIKMKHAA